MTSRHSYLHIDPFVLYNALESDLVAFRKLSNTFCTIALPMLLRVENAMRVGDDVGIAQACHALKGSTSLVGARLLTERLHQIDMIAQRHGALDVELLTDELRQLLEAVLLEVRLSMTDFYGGSSSGRA